MAKATTTEKDEELVRGPVSLFRNKIRKPVSLTLTPEHHKIVDKGVKRLGITRADFIALLINEFGATIEIPTALSKR